LVTVSRANIDALTGLRFVAAFTIAFGHTHPTWLSITGVGMPLFFTLSGFIIHYVYADPFAAGWRRATGEFAIARISRIYPLYLALLLYYLLRSPMGSELAGPANVPIVVSYFLACWTWWPIMVDGHLLLNFHYHISWSVSTEIFFYICYALFFYRIALIRSVGRCLVALAAFCLTSCLLFYCVFLTRDLWEPWVLQNFPYFASRTEDFTQSFYRWLLYISPYSRIFEFIGGCLTCQLFLLVRRHPSCLRRLHPGMMAAAAVAAIAVLVVAFDYVGNHHQWLAVGDHSLAAFFVNLHMNFLFAPACYLLIFSLALGGSAVSRAISGRIPRFLGDISYSTYLTHPMAESVLRRLPVHVSSPVAHLVVIMAIVYIMSWVSYSAIEVPAKRWLRRVVGRRRVSVPSLTGGV
jgi:peptidoglycan/LPS O-acetylase OafA/YrhL